MWIVEYFEAQPSGSHEFSLNFDTKQQAEVHAQELRERGCQVIDILSPRKQKKLGLLNGQQKMVVEVPVPLRVSRINGGHWSVVYPSVRPQAMKPYEVIFIKASTEQEAIAGADKKFRRKFRLNGKRKHRKKTRRG